MYLSQYLFVCLPCCWRCISMIFDGLCDALNAFRCFGPDHKEIYARIRRPISGCNWIMACHVGIVCSRGLFRWLCRDLRVQTQINACISKITSKSPDYIIQIDLLVENCRKPLKQTCRVSTFNFFFCWYQYYSVLSVLFWCFFSYSICKNLRKEFSRYRFVHFSWSKTLFASISRNKGNNPTVMRHLEKLKVFVCSGKGEIGADWFIYWFFGRLFLCRELLLMLEVFIFFQFGFVLSDFQYIFFLGWLIYGS